MEDSSPRERRSERTRQAILDTALLLIIEKGLDKLSLREIARRVDYSPAGLYEYFGSKDEIVEAVIGDGHSRFYAQLDRVPKDLPQEVYLVELGMAYIEFAQLYPDHFMLMFTHFHVMPNIDLATFTPDAESDAYGLLVQGVQRAVDAGVIHAREGFNTIGISYSLWSLVHGLAMLQATYLRVATFDFKTVDRYALVAFIEGLKQG